MPVCTVNTLDSASVPQSQYFCMFHVFCMSNSRFRVPKHKERFRFSFFNITFILFFFNTKYKNSGEGPQSTLVNTTLNNPSHITSGMTGLSAHYRSLFLSSLFEFNKKKEVISGRVGAFSYTYDKLDI